MTSVHAAGLVDQPLPHAAGDAVIVLAEDDDAYAPGAQLPELNPMGACPAWHARARRERVLFLGWRRDMHDMIEVLDQFVSKGSELFLYNEVSSALS